MRLALPHATQGGIDEGDVVAGRRVTGCIRRSPGERVYSACDRDGREVTLVAGSVPTRSREVRARFRRLARLRAGAEHPGLLEVWEWGELPGLQFLVTEPYPRETLADVLRDAPMGPSSALALLAPVADALDLCHARGLVHQNLTDESILLAADGAVLDGFAVATVGHPRQTFEARALRYAPPELARGDPLEPASNVHSLAALLVHLLTGQAPYPEVETAPSNAAWATAILHLTAPPPRPSETAPALGSEIDEAIAWGMAKEPSDRPLSATGLLDAVAHALHLAAPAAPARFDSRDVPAAAAPRRRAGRRRVGRLAGVAAVVSAVAIGAAAGTLADPFGDPSAGVGAERRSEQVVADLGERRAALRSELADAALPDDQAEAAAALAATYRGVARRADSAALASAARAAASAYADLAGAVAAGSEADFADASLAVSRAEARVEGAVRAPGNFRTSANR